METERFNKLLKYKNYPETTKCYLDGRYFNLVLKEICPGLIEHPLIITIKRDDHKKLKGNMFMGYSPLNDKELSFIRVIVQADDMRHSMLLIVDPQRKESFLWNATSKDSEYYRVVEDGIKQITKELFGNNYEMVSETVGISNIVPKTCQGKPVGYCNAYVIKRVIDIMHDKSFDGSEILRFVSAVEDNYSDLLTGEPDIEYWGGGLLLGGLGLGLLGGVAIGAAAAGASRPYY